MKTLKKINCGMGSITSKFDLKMDFSYTPTKQNNLTETRKLSVSFSFIYASTKKNILYTLISIHKRWCTDHTLTQHTIVSNKS